jgi:hypothetical protein
MGQFYVVQGRDAGAAARVLQRLLDAATGLGEPANTESLVTGATAVATGPRRHGESVGPQRAPDGGVVASSGAWLSHWRHDAEALLALAPALRTGGAAWDEAAATLDGAFVLVSADADGREALLATDRIGTQHAYHATLDGCAVVAHSALVLAVATGVALDPMAARELLAAGSVFEDRSLFTGVRKLPPGARLRLTPAGLVVEGRWWDPASIYVGSEAARETPGGVPALASALVAATDALLARWPDAVFDLTGGFDSRAVLAAALAAGHSPRTVVVGPDRDADVAAAGRIAGEFGLTLAQLRPGTDYGPRSLADLTDALLLTDGEADAVEYAGVAGIQERMASGAGPRGATVNGTAGEFCRGYWWICCPGWVSRARASTRGARRPAASRPTAGPTR